MMPVAVESTADVRIAGMSTFSMTYDYQMVDGQAVSGAHRRADSASLRAQPLRPAPFPEPSRLRTFAYEPISLPVRVC